MAGIQLKQVSVKLNKPTYIGMANLDIVMYRLHYNFIMTKYPEAKLLFSDRDSFYYLITKVTSMMI